MGEKVKPLPTPNTVFPHITCRGEAFRDSTLGISIPPPSNSAVGVLFNGIQTAAGVLFVGIQFNNITSTPGEGSGSRDQEGRSKSGDRVLMLSSWICHEKTVSHAAVVLLEAG